MSISDQHTDNQLAELRAWADTLGMEAVAEYVTEGSARVSGQWQQAAHAQVDVVADGPRWR